MKTTRAGREFDVDIEACRRTFLERQERERADREARRMAALESARRAVLGRAASFPSLQAAYLFGSVVRPGAFRSVSDVDLAVRGLGPDEYFRFWREVEEAAPDLPIDLRDLAGSASFAERVRRTGCLIYERKDPPPQG